MLLSGAREREKSELNSQPHLLAEGAQSSAEAEPALVLCCAEAEPALVLCCAATSSLIRWRSYIPGGSVQARARSLSLWLRLRERKALLVCHAVLTGPPTHAEVERGPIQPGCARAYENYRPVCPLYKNYWASKRVI